jgi:hypothetical protein
MPVHQVLNLSSTVLMRFSHNLSMSKSFATTSENGWFWAHILDDERNYWSPSARMVNFNLFQSNIATFSTWLTRLGLTTNWTAMYKSLSAATLHSSERSSYPPCLQRSAMPVGVKPSLNAWNEN